jgi:hypothetical protein
MRSRNAGAILDQSKRKDGTTLNELVKETGWQAQSARGFLRTTTRKWIAGGQLFFDGCDLPRAVCDLQSHWYSSTCQGDMQGCFDEITHAALGLGTRWVIDPELMAQCRAKLPNSRFGNSSTSFRRSLLYANREFWK